MNNYKLLEKYRKRLSVYFAFFVMFSFWFIQAVFYISEYIPDNIELEKKLLKKISGVENVLKNHEKYFEKINNKDTTLLKIVNKTLENVVVYENCNKGICSKKLIENIENLSDVVINSKKQFIDEGDYKYIIQLFQFKGINYNIIIKIFNDSSVTKVFNNYIFFILFTLPFIFLFYFIGYYFIGKNFKPIKETISGLEDFTSNINHEMKTPLAEIISTLSLAKKIKNYDEAIDSSLKSSQKLTKILDSMLGIVNLVDSRYKKERINVVKELNNVIFDNIKEVDKKKIIIKKSFNDNDFYLRVNREHFDICVGNILKNAIKYSNKKGIIEISFKKGKLIIKDYGIGISNKNIKNIFNRYFRESYTNEEGYGLGLSLVKKIIDLNGWKIVLKSQKRNSDNGKKGTIVTITFI